MTESSDLHKELDLLLRDLFPLNRSLTGEANRLTIQRLQSVAPFLVHEVRSGTKVFDWTIPDEWNLRRAMIADAKGRILVDSNQSNLHVVGYSKAVDQKMPFSELEPHLHIHHDDPRVIPYRTSYYQREWGFCVTGDQYLDLKHSRGPLRVRIDATLKPGSLTYADLILPGSRPDEILFSTYFCHPSLANDNLSGLVVTAALARAVSQIPQRRWTYRFILVPETIGAIAYLALNSEAMKSVKFGAVITNVGGPGSFDLKLSWDPSHPVNRIARLALEASGSPFQEFPFDVHGSDERQFSSPAFRINTITISKDKYYEYPEYHTSADNLDFVSTDSLIESLFIYQEFVRLLEHEDYYESTCKAGEPQLGRRKMYASSGGKYHPERSREIDDALLWLLFLGDGHHSVQDACFRTGLDERVLLKALAELEGCDLARRF